MIRSVVTLVRLCSDRRGSMISGLSDACLRWEIGICAITHQLRNVNWTQPELDLILLCHWLDGPSEFSCNRIRQLSWFIVRILRRFHTPADWCRGLTLPVRRACRHLLFLAPVRWATPLRGLSISVAPLEDRTLLSGGASVNSDWPLPGSRHIIRRVR